MTNLDLINQSRAKFSQQMMDAVRDDKPEQFAEAMTGFATEMQDMILQQAQELIGTNDAAILAQRGVRQLTSDESKYYQSLIEALRTSNPKQALTDLNKVLPKTTIDAIFDNLTENHPLLSEIDFMNTNALVEILVSTSGGVAGWGELCATIDKELSGSFDIINLTLMKLYAFIPVCKAMLDLGPTWLDSWVRTVLAEALAVQLEAAIVDGDGKTKPIGMTRKLTGATDSVYPQKTAIAITDLSPVTIGGILNTISKGPNDKRRAVPSLLMVVNPEDYYTKVYPATTVRTTIGSYVYDVLPYPMKVVVSAAAPVGKAIFGLAKKYFMGLGTSKGGKLEYSDEYKFLEDQRVYLIKLYGNGRAMDENAFVLADISALKPYVQQVEVVTPEG